MPPDDENPRALRLRCVTHVPKFREKKPSPRYLILSASLTTRSRSFFIFFPTEIPFHWTSSAFLSLSPAACGRGRRARRPPPRQAPLRPHPPMSRELRLADAIGTDRTRRCSLLDGRKEDGHPCPSLRRAPPRRCSLLDGRKEDGRPCPPQRRAPLRRCSLDGRKDDGRPCL